MDMTKMNTTPGKDGFCQAPIESVAEACAGANGTTRSDTGGRRISSPMALAIEAEKALKLPFAGTMNTTQERQFSLFTTIACGPEYGLEFYARVMKIDSGPIQDKYKMTMSRRKGWNEAPDRMLLLYVNDICTAVFSPEIGAFVSCAQIKGDLPVPWFHAGTFHDPTPVLKKDPRALERTLGYFSKNPHLMKFTAVRGFLAQFQALTDEQAQSFDWEPYTAPDAEAAKYCKMTASDMNLAALTGCLSSEESFNDYMVKKLCVVPDEAEWREQAAQYCLHSWEDSLILCPVKDNVIGDKMQICSVSWCENPISNSFTVTVCMKINGVKQYSRRDYAASQMCQTVLPDIIETLTGNQEAGTHSYIVGLKSGMNRTNLADVESQVQFYPADKSQNSEIHYAVAAPERKWTKVCRSQAVNALVVYDENGESLGMIRVCSSSAEPLKPNTTFFVAGIDAAATNGRVSYTSYDTVTEKTILPTNFETGELTRPLTSIKKSVFDTMVNEECSADIRKGSYISMVQRFNTYGSQSGIMLELAKARVLGNDMEFIRNLIRNSKPDDGDVYRQKGIQAYPKIHAQHNGAAAEALALLNGQQILLAVAKGMKEGYDPSCISIRIGYPEGNRAALTAIENGVSYANEWLDGALELKLEKNVFPVHEALAAGKYITCHAPDGVVLRDYYVVMDIGHSTCDVFLFCKGRYFTGSLPFAGHDIMEKSLAEAFGSNAKQFLNIKQVLTKSSKVQALLNDMQKYLPGSRLNERIDFSDNAAFATYTSMLLDDLRPVDTDATRLASMLIRYRLCLAFQLVDHMIQKAYDEGYITDAVSKLDVVMVGKGSLSMNQVLKSDNFRQELEQRSSDIAGISVEIHPGNDTEKRSVAFGLLEFDHAPGSIAPIVPKVTPVTDDPDEHLFHLAGSTDEAAELLRKIRENQSKKSFGANITGNAQMELKALAFDKIAEQFQWENYKEFLNEALLPPENDTFGLERKHLNEILVDVGAQQDFRNMPAQMQEFKEDVMNACGYEDLAYKVICTSIMLTRTVCRNT